MNRYLITGFSGFVAGHFIDYLYSINEECEIIGISRRLPNIDLAYYADRLSVKVFCIDMIDKDAVKDVIREFCPDYVLHLAAYSSVAYSWEYPTDSFLNNCNLFLNLVDVIREINPHCRILSVGSSEEYGGVNSKNLPLTEDQALNPMSPYAVARVSQELMSKVYVNAYGMDIIMTRSFNHIGPRQDDRFVVPSFIKRIIDLKRQGACEGVINTGDTEIVRDFVDVRDVVRAYYMLLMKGSSGEVYNICSGSGIRLSNIIDCIAKEVGITVSAKVIPELIRPSENKTIVGSFAKIQSELGWEPEIDFKTTIRDMIIHQNATFDRCNRRD